MSWAPAARADGLAMGFAAVVAVAVGMFGWSALSIGIPLALLMLILADGIARPGSSLLYPTLSHGSRDGRQVALSFDDGPDPDVTPAVLDVLARHGARATFFTIGRALQANPALANRIADEHHELGNHSWSHSRWQNFWGTHRQRREIERGARAITSLGRSRLQPLYRPPIGLKSPPLARAARSLGLTVVAWSLHSRDTRSDDPRRIARRVLERVRPGDIVLMHDGHDRPGLHRPACAQALPLILEGFARKGLQCVTVSELIGAQCAASSPHWARRLWQGLAAHVGLKMLAGWLIAGGFFAGYFLLLKFPLFPVTLMPVLAADHWIPFWPGALWLYASLWLYVALAPGLLTDRRELLDYYVAMVALSMAGMTVFLLWPTASPHPNIPWAGQSALGFVIAADDNGNALPSLHAAFAVFSAIWMEWLLRRAAAPGWLRMASAAWGCGIVYSTLATRQHVLVDVIAGCALGGLAAVLHARWLHARRAAPCTPLEPEPSA